MNPINTAKLRPVVWEKLVRVGAENDGGYVVPEQIIENADALISFGLNLDWEFERAFNRLNKSAVVHCYDHTVSSTRLIKHSVKSLLKGLFTLSPKRLRETLIYLDYAKLFRGNVTHFRKRIWRDNSKNSATIKDVFDRLKDRKHIFVKMDIEGSEYRVLDDILNYSLQIDAMTIEFHELDLLPERFNECIASIGKYFYIVHIHANNFSDLTRYAFPSAVEITFASMRLNTNIPPFSDFKYPVVGLDRPCNPAAQDYPLEFAAVEEPLLANISL